jgi:hypothetical protein
MMPGENSILDSSEKKEYLPDNPSGTDPFWRHTYNII